MRTKTKKTKNTKNALPISGLQRIRMPYLKNLQKSKGFYDKTVSKHYNIFTPQAMLEVNTQIINRFARRTSHALTTSPHSRCTPHLHCQTNHPNTHRPHQYSCSH